MTSSYAASTAAQGMMEPPPTAPALRQGLGATVVPMRQLHAPRTDRAYGLVDFLNEMPWFRQLAPADQKWISQRMTERSLKAGEVLAPDGERAVHAYTVLDGMLKWSTFSRNGQEVTFSCQVRGSWFGHATLMGMFERRGSIAALKDSRVTCMPKDVLDWLLANSIEFTNFLLRDFNERLQWFLRAFAARTTLTVDEQIVRAIYGLFHPRLNPGAPSTIHVSQDEIAHLSGFSRQRCNRTLVRLRKAGFITTGYGYLTIIDREAIRAIAEDGFECT